MATAPSLSRVSAGRHLLRPKAVGLRAMRPTAATIEPPTGIPLEKSCDRVPPETPEPLPTLGREIPSGVFNRICPRCGGPVIRRSLAVFCSERCRKRAETARWRARHRAMTPARKRGRPRLDGVRRDRGGRVLRSKNVSPIRDNAINRFGGTVRPADRRSPVRRADGAPAAEFHSPENMERT